MRVVLASGGKDSLYAASRTWPVDAAVILVYDFPRPSPHLANLSKSAETWLATGTPVIVARLERGKEREDTVRLLRMLGAETIVAGDVYIEDHLRYLEGVASDAGARLLEPLWGMDPVELLYREFEWGIEALVIGAQAGLAWLVGRLLTLADIDEVVDAARRQGFDPLGEHGEYHTLVVNSPLHKQRVRYEKLRIEDYGDYTILRLV